MITNKKNTETGHTKILSKSRKNVLIFKIL